MHGDGVRMNTGGRDEERYRRLISGLFCVQNEVFLLYAAR